MFRITPYHWTPIAQRRFIETLAATGSVQLACDSVSMSRVSAYRFRRRAEGAAFAVGWDAAVLIAQQEHGDKLMHYALEPIESIGTRHPETRRLRWRRSDPALGRGKGMALLQRLDTASAKLGDVARARAHAAMGDFEVFLGLVERGDAEDKFKSFFLRSGDAGFATVYM
jgi:hypothetical protein